MQPNYELEARRKQEEQEAQSYQRQRDPFQYGQQVARRRYSEIMSGLQERQTQSAQAYSDLYQQARERSVSQRAAGAPSLSGGMQAQYSDLVSAREMRELGGIGMGREQAARDIDLQRQSAFANAELEGQQAEQIGLQRQQTQLELIRQKNAIVTDAEMTNEQKAEQLRVLGYEEDANKILEAPETAGNAGAFAGIAAGLGGTYTVLKATGAVAKLKTAMAGTKLGWAAGAAVGLKAAFVIAGIGAILYGAERIAEASGVREGQGFVDWNVLGMR